ncbi:2-methylaconitate cis-trans isomerase PrpF [Vibrio sp. V27_P1S3P104]|uniref:2-methylaconitate cis-trans isomerase PrpF n=1 Tax=unclassified Vibrio TaxID=2614977 RepID=UPI0013728C55|nr:MULTISPECIES: 2-methylaconitate cis-trans isomerase PrpF [unclassified Vibrio]NAW68763.1 2-methylaconitate cis-trans isomerase PrpF [Vibrio sp. V28_P6S34P95]NAX03670.1 2-methylaconitate cis-trans isomerase PrpF [Vibrio sp. V30_P3S12P165]NAX35023.1 2-methylaconitate cis-trans isomerase PrpF [Vibrio sp. V29_P1S30P107]NAX36359.1 2-methylaconitate cis-trans isomerase PrpF [Vibrio sp. V27_P1S3P104]NAX41796.1 2-methylaconitate cis-trans isomerase PrpF [Vibrio sp. V26_P1S5P106]
MSDVNIAPQLRIPATYLRGGTSKGVFFKLSDLPLAAQVPGEARDKLLLRVIGSPDAYGKQIDGMGGATSSTSKAVIVSKSEKKGHDVDYLFGQVSIDKPFVDWSGNCGNLSAAVGPFAIHAGLIDPQRIPEHGVVEVNIWQVNIQKSIVVHVPIINGEVQEVGEFELDGVTFPAAEIQVDFLDPAEGEGSMFPTGNLRDTLVIPGFEPLQVTLINAGIPTIFVDASAIGYRGCELQDEINNDPHALARFETLRAYGALKMGLITDLEEAKVRQHTPKIAFVSPPKNYLTASGKTVTPQQVDVLVRALSMGKLHHAMMGTAAVAIAAAACVPGTIVNQAAGGGEKTQVVFGHPSGTLKVGAKACHSEQGWRVEKAVMSRSARILMEGWVRVPAESLKNE